MVPNDSPLIFAQRLDNAREVGDIESGSNFLGRMSRSGGCGRSSNSARAGSTSDNLPQCVAKLQKFQR